MFYVIYLYRSGFLWIWTAKNIVKRFNSGLVVNVEFFTLFFVLEVVGMFSYCVAFGGCRSNKASPFFSIQL